MNTPFPPFSRKLLVIAIAAALGGGVPFVASAVSVITMDGTTGVNPAGTPINPTGATYIINGDGANRNGTQNGSNLFFSFSQFGIGAGDTALFQCASCVGITNVISRVTGFIPSILNGTLTSTIGTANFWFFNPSGGAVNGAVNVPVSASYYISNGNSVNFSPTGTFGLATLPTDSTLTAATPVSFGFFSAGTPSTVPPPASLGLITTGSTSTPIYPTPTIITGTNFAPSVPPPTFPSSLRISSQGDISMVVASQPAMVEPVAMPKLPKKPCAGANESSLLSKGVANYVPEASSQVHYSVLGTGATSIESVVQTQSSSSDESDDCL